MDKNVFHAGLRRTAFAAAAAAALGGLSAGYADGSAPEAANDGAVKLDLRPFADAKTPLRNPDKGWYIHYYDNCIDRYGVRNGVFLSPERALAMIPCLDHIYLRLAWSHLEPKEGQFNWQLIDKVIDPYAKAGIGISFRITCKETDRNQYYATPEWVADAGAKGTKLGNAWEPDYGDPVFLEKLDNFHRAFAERYAGRPDLVYVDIGSYGDWGEGHTASSSHRDWPWEALKAHFDIYRKHYGKALVAVSDDFIGSRRMAEGKKEMLQYVLDNDWTFRDDSISVKWFVDHIGTRMRSPELFDAVWEKVPTVLELDHYHGTIASKTWRNGEILDESIVRAHATYAGFHGYPERWIAENREYAAKAGNKLGYWYFIDEVRARKNGGGLDIEIDWRNMGAAKAYVKYAFDVILTDKSGKDLVFRQDAFDNTAFAPGAAATTSHQIRGVPPGEYTLSVRMSKGERPVYIAVDAAHTRKDGACIAGDVKL